MELSEAFGFINLALPGYEADDILGTLARQAEAEGRETFIVTGDRDALQLAGEHVHIMSNTRGITEVKVYDPAAVEERFGVPPRLIPDLIGLKGDTSDNIPGVPGIGEKTAAQLLAQFGSLEEVLAHADEVSGAKRRELLVEHRETALLSKKLALLDVDVPIDITTAEVLPHELQRDRLEELLTRFEFGTLLDRLGQLFPRLREAGQDEAGARLAAPAAPPQDAQAWQSLFDWSRPVGMAAEDTSALPGTLEPAAGVPCASGWPRALPGKGPRPTARSSVCRSSTLRRQLPSIRPLLEGGGAVCHDLKSSPALQTLVEQAGHDTYVAAYLLAPNRRDTPLPSWPAKRACGHRSASPRRAGRPRRPWRSRWPSGRRRSCASRACGICSAISSCPSPRSSSPWRRSAFTWTATGWGRSPARSKTNLRSSRRASTSRRASPSTWVPPQQMGRMLFDRLGLPRQRKTKTGYSTDAKTLESLRDSHPIVGCILNHRELSKLMSTYLLALPPAVHQDTGRLHTTFNQTVAATGRLSSSDPNLQNIPVRTAVGAQIRQCFRAEPGFTFVVADYSQIELHIMAHLSGEPALLESFAKGEDIHTRTAAEVFGLEEGEVDSTHRRYAKAVNFGIMYGISAFGLSQNLGIEREEAAAYIQAYFDRLPRVKAFIESTIETGRRQGYVTTVFGRRRDIPEFASPNFQTRSLGERLAVNSVIQGTAADIIKVAMIRCHQRLRRDFPGARLVLQVHDELVFEVPEDLAEAVKTAVVKEMVEAFPMDPPLGVDAGIGPDWLSAK